MQVPFRLALALLIQSPQEWDAARRTVLLHTLHAHLQPGPSFAAVAPPSRSAVSETEAGLLQLWREAAPAVRLFGMVDQLQRRLKVTDGGTASWQAAMNQRYAVGFTLTGRPLASARFYQKLSGQDQNSLHLKNVSQ